MRIVSFCAYFKVLARNKQNSKFRASFQLSRKSTHKTASHRQWQNKNTKILLSSSSSSNLKIETKLKSSLIMNLIHDYKLASILADY